MYQSGQKSNLTHKRGTIALPNPKGISRPRSSHKASRTLPPSPNFCLILCYFHFTSSTSSPPWDGKTWPLSPPELYLFTDQEPWAKSTGFLPSGSSELLGMPMSRFKLITEARVTNWPGLCRPGALSGFSEETGKWTRPVLQEMLCSVMRIIMDHFSKKEILGKHHIWSLLGFSLNTHLPF